MGSKMLFWVVLRMYLAVKRQNKEAVASFLSSPTLEISDGNLTDQTNSFKKQLSS